MYGPLLEDRIGPLELFILLPDLVHQDTVVLHKPDLFDRAVRYRGDELNVLERLEKVVVRAGPEGGDRIIRRSIAGHDDGLGVRAVLFNKLDKFDAAHVSHPDVGKNQGEGMFPK